MNALMADRYAESTTRSRRTWLRTWARLHTAAFIGQLRGPGNPVPGK